MALKKAKEFRFTFEDAAGRLRVVYLQAQHFVEDSGADQVRLHVTSDGIPLDVKTFVDQVAQRKVTTRSEL